MSLRLAETLTLYSTIAYYKILQYICAAKPLAEIQEEDMKYSRYGNDKQKA